MEKNRMFDSLEILLKEASLITMSDSEKSAQRQSFAYGNTKLHNEDITRETVKSEAKNVIPQLFADQ